MSCNYRRGYSDVWQTFLWGNYETTCKRNYMLGLFTLSRDLLTQPSLSLLTRQPRHIAFVIKPQGILQIKCDSKRNAQYREHRFIFLTKPPLNIVEIATRRSVDATYEIDKCTSPIMNHSDGHSSVWCLVSACIDLWTGTLSSRIQLMFVYSDDDFVLSTRIVHLISYYIYIIHRMCFYVPNQNMFIVKQILK